MVQILFKWATKRTSVVSLFLKHNCLQALHLLIQAPDVELKLITRALYLCLMKKSGETIPDDTLSLQLVNDDEMIQLKIMLNTDLSEPFSFHGLSFRVLFLMMKFLASVSLNVELFLQWDIPSLIAQLSERLTGEAQEIATELIWNLMQCDNEVTETEIFTEDIASSQLEQPKGWCSGYIHACIYNKKTVTYNNILS